MKPVDAAQEAWRITRDFLRLKTIRKSQACRGVKISETTNRTTPISLYVSGEGHLNLTTEEALELAESIVTFLEEEK
jgi:hypothetical protein